MATPLKPGELVAGKYRVLCELGHGGMGVVMAAEHVDLRQRVAIKVLRSSGDGSAGRRFDREAQIAVVWAVYGRPLDEPLWTLSKAAVSKAIDRRCQQVDWTSLGPR